MKEISGITTFQNVRTTFSEVSKALLDERVKEVMVETLRGFKERYAIEPSTIGFDQNHIHAVCRFLPKYSGGQGIRTIKSITGQQIFDHIPDIKKVLWGGEFWTDGYYIATIKWQRQ